MSVEDRLHSLQNRHASVEAELKQETRRPLPDPSSITRLKREKLKLKDEMLRQLKAAIKALEAKLTQVMKEHADE